MYHFARLIGLTLKADQGAGQVDALKDFLRQNPDLITDVHNLTSETKLMLLRAAVPGAGTRAFVEREMAELGERLTGEGASPIERLLVDAVLLGWLRMLYAEGVRTRYMTGSHNFREIEFAERMLTHSHKRCAYALKALARVQKFAGQRGRQSDRPLKAVNQRLPLNG